VKSCKKSPVAILNCPLSDRSKNEKDLSRIPEKESWIFIGLPQYCGKSYVPYKNYVLAYYKVIVY